MEYLAKIRTGDPNANPFFTLMGVTVVDSSSGMAGLTMTVRPDMQNGVGWLQGGMFTALADEAMALALYQQLEDGEGIATISENTSFFKGAQAGKLLYAEGRVIRKGRRVAFVEGEVREGGRDGQILSRTVASFAVVRKE